MADELTSRFARELAKLQQRINDLEKGSRSPQLGNASLDLDSTRGYIPIRQKGVERGRIGRQPDGTISFTSVNNPEPPPVPIPIQVEPTLAGVRVTVYGFQGEQPHDFSHVRVYCDGILAGTISALPGSLVVAPLNYSNHVFWATALNLSGQESDETPSVTATPNKAVSDDITAGIIDATKIADEAITRAKIAVGAIGQEQLSPDLEITPGDLEDGSVTESKLAEGAVTYDKIAAAAVLADAIAANAVIAGKIAAGAVTATEIAALTIQAGNIAADAIAAGKIAADAITAREIAALAVTADKLAANSVTAAAIAAGSITADHLAAELILASRLVIGPEDDWHVELNTSNSPLMYWNNEDIGFALSRDETTNKATVYVSGRMEFGEGSQIDSDIIDIQELPSSGYQQPKVRQSRTWMQSEETTSCTPRYLSPTMKTNLILMTVWQVSSYGVPNCSTPVGASLVQSYTNGNNRLTTWILQNPNGSRTFENFTSSVRTGWAITLTEFQGTVIPTSLDAYNYNQAVGGNDVMTTGDITPSVPNTLQIAVFGNRGGHLNKDNFSSAINGFSKQVGAGSQWSFGTALYVKTANSNSSPSNTTVHGANNTTWSSQIISFKLAPASTIPPAPNTDRTVRWYTRRVQGVASPHLIQSDGYTYPIGRAPYCKVQLVDDEGFGTTAGLDVFAQSGWQVATDSWNMAAVASTGGSYSYIVIPVTGLYEMHMRTIWAPTAATSMPLSSYNVHYITHNSRTAEASQFRQTGVWTNTPGTAPNPREGSIIVGSRQNRLGQGAILYWGHYSSVNARVLGRGIGSSPRTEITITYLGPGV